MVIEKAMKLRSEEDMTPAPDSFDVGMSENIRDEASNVGKEGQIRADSQQDGNFALCETPGTSWGSSSPTQPCQWHCKQSESPDPPWEKNSLAHT